jgi:hypothetical protein
MLQAQPSLLGSRATQASPLQAPGSRERFEIPVASDSFPGWTRIGASRTTDRRREAIDVEEWMQP